MNRGWLRTMLAIGVVGLLEATGYGQASNDLIHVTDGPPVRGTITEMSRTEVTINFAGAPRRIPVNEIKRITYADDTSELRNARDAVAQGQLQDALDQLKEVKLGAADREVLRQDVAFYSAVASARLALSGGGDIKQATALVMDFVKKNSGSYHFYEAVETLGDLAVALGAYDKAALYYSQISKAPWRNYQLRGAILEARALHAAGKFAEAEKKYKLVTGAPANDPESARQKTLATVGRAACMAEMGNPDPAIKVLQDIINKNDSQDVELFARAYNALGDCYRKANKPKDALMAYLHVDILFVQDADAHAEALSRLTDLWTQVEKPDRAVQARNLLKSRYAGSRWANK